MSFKDEFAKTPGGPQREQLVYSALVSQGKPTDLWPVTVPGPNGTQVTYNITRDFLNVDGFYTPMTATTAQKLADYFGMFLPTNKIADQVWKSAKGKINVNPLSGTGYQGADKFYSPQEVVAGRIGASDAAVAFNDNIQKARSQNPATQKELVDIGSGVKWLTVPPASGSLGLHGIRTPSGGTIQGGYGTMHPNYEDHTEYGTFVRLVGPTVTITKADGTKSEPIPMEKFATMPEAVAIFEPSQDLRGGQLAKYDLKRDKAGLAKLDKNLTQPSQKAPSGLEQINQFLDQTMTQIASRIPLYEMVLKYAEVSEAAPLDPATVVSPKDYGYSPGVPPAGYEAMGIKGRAPKPIEDTAKQVLAMFLANKSQYPIGSMIPFTVGDKKYMARAEVHSNSPYGISVYQAKSDGSSSSQGRMKLLQRVQNTPDKPQAEIENLFSEIERDI